MAQEPQGIGASGIGEEPLGAGFFEYDGALTCSFIPGGTCELDEVAPSFDYDGTLSIAVSASARSSFGSLSIAAEYNSFFHPTMELAIVE